jgi:hypothetical protein
MKRNRAEAGLQVLLTSSLLAAGAAFAEAPVNAVPPAQHRPAHAAAKAAPAQMLLPATAASTRIALPALSGAERGKVKAMNARAATNDKEAARGSKGRPLAVGFGRDVGVESRSIALESLRWKTLPDGTRVARIEVASPEAAALRVAMRLAATVPDLSIRFSGNGANAQVIGPVAASTIAGDTSTYGLYWSSTLEGDVARIELEARPGAKLGGARLVIPRVSHQVITGLALRRDTKSVVDIGRAGACNIDVKCVSPQSTAFVNSTRAVASILFSDEAGFAYLCTGTLLNDSTTSNTPYLFTASHCIDSATAARTIDSYWFFDAVACGSTAVPPGYVLQTGGAALLARSVDWDWAIVRLNQPPPSAVTFAAWRTDLVPAQETVSIVHHPQGDLKKWAQGTSLGYQNFSDGSSFIQARYSQGTTEGGSSGAALMTFNAAGNYYEVRGGLFGGDALCTNPTGIDIYSRIDNMLPLTREYLTPGNNPSGTIVVVEFYNRALQHYFMTAAPGEINDLDTGVHVGWERTGLRFLAYASPVAGTNPVCRFYRDPSIPNGDSHYYSASPIECAQTAARFPDWFYESANVFYVALPDPITGACAAGSLPIWRFFNKVFTNHRYTADITTRDELLDDPGQWQPDGYGPGPGLTAMCTPVGS